MDLEFDVEDEAWLEAEIQRELDAVIVDDEETRELISDDTMDLEDTKVEDTDNGAISPTMQEYFDRVHGQTSYVEKELLDCDTLLNQIEKKIDMPTPLVTDDDLLSAAREKGKDPLKMKIEILEQLDREDEEELEMMANTPRGDVQETEQAAFLTETGEVKPQTSAVEESVRDDSSLSPGEGTVVVYTEADELEKQFGLQLEAWRQRQQKKELDRRTESDKRLEEFRQRIQESEERRMVTLQRLDEEGRRLSLQREAEEARFQQLSEAQKQRMVHSMQSFQAQIEALSGEVEKEQQVYEEIKREAEERTSEQRRKAAVKIQAYYRRHRVLKVHGPTVRSWIAQRREEMMAEKLMKAEVNIRKRKEREKGEALNEQIKEEEKLLEDVAAKEEENRKNREELEAKKRKEELLLKIEDEKRQREEERLKEEQRKQEEKRLKEEEKRLKEEKQKRKKEEEKQRKEEEKRRKAEELRLKKEEEKRRKEEEKRKEEERRIEERRKEEEKRREERRIEERRKEEERKVEERRKEEQRKEGEREKEEKRKEEERLREEELKREREEAERLERERKMGEEKNREELKRQEEEKRQGEEKRQEGEERKQEEERVEVDKTLEEERVGEENRKREERKHEEKSKVEESKMEVLRKKECAEEKRKTDERLKKLAEEERKEKLDRMMKKKEDMKQEAAGPNLEEMLQQRRIAWMQACTPWSKISMEMKTRRIPVSKRPIRRPSSAKNQASLPEHVILNGAEVKSLSEVTTVELCDLPGYSISPLGQCRNLQYLSMTGCNLLCLDGLSACTKLAVLECQNNKIEVINLAKLEELLYVNLSSNNLTSIHGLDGCKNVRYLNMSKNRITRISSLVHCPLLHTLDLSYNQLIRSQGLNESPTIQVLELSHNNLQSLDDVDKLGLLRKLDASSNNLLQFPSLTNQVLLEELLLNDNSISSLDNLTSCWLPLLNYLSLDQNSLTSLEDLGSCPLLRKLNIGNNQLIETTSLVKVLPSLRRLEQLWLAGNPFTELNKSYRSDVISGCPTVQFIDNERVQTPNKVAEKPGSFEKMCLQQHQVNQAIWENYQKHISSMVGESALLTAAVHKDYFEKSYKIVVDSRYSHEYGEIKTDSNLLLEQNIGTEHKGKLNMSDTAQKDSGISLSSSHSKSDSSKSASLNSGSDANLKDSKAKFDAMVVANMGAKTKEVKESDSRSSLEDPRSSKSKFEEALIGAGMAKNFDSSIKESKSNLQEPKTNYMDSKLKFESMLQGSDGKSPRLNGSRKPATSAQVVEEALGKARLENAATMIQAHWRGYYLRKQIQHAYHYARMNGEEEEDMFGEVDLSAFDVNEDDLERGWTPSEVPQIPMNHAILKPSHPSDLTPHPPVAPRQAWREGQGMGKPPLPPSSVMSGQETQRTWQSRKEEKISEEWGFKDSKTAELMMQRAKKLKYNALRKKKLSQLDPQQRLSLMKKLQEANNLSPVQPPKRPLPNKKEYFKAKEDEVHHKQREHQEEMKNKAARMYEWLHSAVERDDVTPSPGADPLPSNGNTSLFRARCHNSDGNLPRLNPELIAGGRVMLTGSPVSLELQSVDGSQVESEKPRRYSVGETRRTPTQFPPIKTNSAPSKKPERISWRNPETNQSVGWGGGKKRTHKT